MLHAVAHRLSSTEELDSQALLFSLVNLVVDRLGTEVVPHAPGLLALLPAVWEAADGQELLRMQVLVTMARLCNALGPASASAHAVLLPMLGHALGDQPVVVLVEDALAAWLVALRNAPSAVGCEALLTPLPVLPALVSQSTGMCVQPHMMLVIDWETSMSTPYCRSQHRVPAW